MKGILFGTTCLFLLVALTLTPLSAKAESELPSVVLAGLNEYKSKGAETAIKAWIKGSPYESSVDAASEANRFKQVEAIYGQLQGYQVIKTKEVTATTKIVYISMEYEKGPLFASFMTYRNGGKHVLVNFLFNMKPEVILPASFF